VNGSDITFFEKVGGCLMKIAILSGNAMSYSTTRLQKAGEYNGHQVDIVDPLHCFIEINSGQPLLRYHGEVMPRYDAVIPRLEFSESNFGTAVIRQFEMMGTFSVNKSDAVVRAQDKLGQLQLLAKEGIRVPRTGFIRETENLKDLISSVGGAPVVIKLLESDQGRGRVSTGTAKSAETIIRAFMGMKVNLLVQEFINEAGGAGIRCLVINGRVIGAIKKAGAERELYSMIHSRGSAEPVRLTQNEKDMAIKAAEIMGLNFCSVDFLQSQKGPIVTDVAPSPELEDIEEVTGRNIAGVVFDHIEKTIAPTMAKPRVTVEII